MPVYNDGWVVNYKDDGGDNTSKIFYGFHDLFNPYDPIVYYGDENKTPVPPTSEDLYWGLSSKATTWEYGYPALDHAYFKMYVPPGTNYFKFIANFEQGREVGLAIRFRSPLKEDYSSVKAFDSYDWQSTPSSLSGFEENDVLLKNGDNTLLMGGSFFPAISEGGWIYFRILNCEGTATIPMFNKTFYVNTASYMDWFNNANFDENGNPEGGYVPTDDFLEENDLDNSGRIDMPDVVLKLKDLDGDGASNPDVKQMLDILSGQ